MACLWVSSLNAQTTRVRGFTDIRATSGEPTEPSGFRLGQFDIFVTSKLSDRFSVLGETVIESEGSDFMIDLERLMVTYTRSPGFRVAIGRHHTPIGYWSTAYHHGELMQPTIGRPLMFHFEDDDGVLPIHTVGLAVGGREIGPLRIGYDLLIGNGIGSSGEGDNNGAKSVTVAVSSQVTSGLTLGASWYADRLAAGTVTLAGDTLQTPLNLRIAGGFGSYQSGSLEAVLEFQRAISGTAGERRSSNLATGYVGVTRGGVTPYLRYDWLDLAPGDRYFPSGSRTLGAIGGRLDLEANAVLKVEWQRERTGRRRTDQLVAQVAVGF